MKFLNHVRKYQLNQLLEISSSLSQRLFKTEGSVAKLIRYDPTFVMKGIYRQAGATYLAPWFLVDISYYAIKNSNDFRAIIPSEQAFLDLYNQFLKFDERIVSQEYEGLEGYEKIFYILFGLSQKSFWFQEMGRLLNMNARFYDLLYRIPKNNQSIPQFYKKIENKYGVNFPTYNIASKALMLISTTNTYFQFPYKLGNEFNRVGINNVLLDDLLADYIEDYDFIRKSTLGAKQLYLTPVVRTAANRLLAVSTFLITRKAMTNLYWETRKIYKDEDGKELNQMLGDSFEIYVDDLLKSYSNKIEYERLPESQKHKMADLVVETEKYVIIIEQKFSMLNISLQDTIFNLAKVDYWLKSYVRAVKQLGETELRLLKSDKIIIKLILFFDNLFIGDGLIKERLIQKCSESKDELINFNNVFMISIGEFEMLVQLIANEEKVFNEIINIKIQRVKNKELSKGVEFEQIYQECGLPINEYIYNKNKELMELRS